MWTRVVTAAWFNFEFDGNLWSSRLQTDSKYWKFDFVLHFIICLNIFLSWSSVEQNEYAALESKEAVCIHQFEH